MKKKGEFFFIGNNLAIDFANTVCGTDLREALGDFLIAPSGQIEAAKYGTHAYDQWSVDVLIALAKGAALQAA